MIDAGQGVSRFSPEWELRFGREDFEGETIDLSPTGVLVKARRILPAGSLVRISLHLSGRMRPVVAAGSVVRILGSRMGFNLTAWISQRASDCRNSSCFWFLKRLPDPLQAHCSNTKSLDCTTSL